MRSSIVFLILAALIAYDAINNDGATTKEAWATITREFDRLRAGSASNPEPTPAVRNDNPG